MLSRVMIGLAGFMFGSLAVRRNHSPAETRERRLADPVEAKPAEAEPWLGAIKELEEKLDARFNAHEWATTSHLTAFGKRLGELDERIKGTASSVARIHDISAAFDINNAHIQMLERKIEEHQRSLDAVAAIAAEVEQKASARIAQVEERLNTQAQALDTLNAATAHAADRLQRLTQSVESLARLAPSNTGLAPKVIQAGSFATAAGEDRALERMFELRL